MTNKSFQRLRFQYISLVTGQIIVLVCIYLSLNPSTSFPIFLCSLGVTALTICFNGLFLFLLWLRNKREALTRQIHEYEFWEGINRKREISEKEIEKDREELLKGLRSQLKAARLGAASLETARQGAVRQEPARQGEVSASVREGRSKEEGKLLEKFSWDSRLCGNMIADIVLKEKMRECAAKEIDFQVQAELPEGLKMKDYHLCSLLTNLLDNAVEACQELPKGMGVIEFKTSLQASYLLIHLENTADIHHVDRPKRIGHGWGREIIQEIVHDYHGEISAAFQKGRFLTDIVIEVL